MIPVAMFYFLKSWGLNELQCTIGGLLTLGFRGVFAFNAQALALVDSVAQLCMVISATLFNWGYWEYGIAVVCIGSMVKESTWLFTFVLSLNLFALAGAIPVALAWIILKPDKQDIFTVKSEDMLRHPLKYGLAFHKDKWLDYRVWLSLGVGLLAFKIPSLQLFAMLGLAAGQMLIATDTIRLLHWCFPVLILYAVPNIPIEWSLIAILLHWVNPFGKEYI